VFELRIECGKVKYGGKRYQPLGHRCNHVFGETLETNVHKYRITTFNDVIAYETTCNSKMCRNEVKLNDCHIKVAFLQRSYSVKKVQVAKVRC